ncbi:MAG: respiratory nitrate reductase subunit gamma [Proteobacteria bacterium]|nr:respiratory nitrate reductase subunit gamma [Pseudomonadota bacterium]
MTKFLWGVYPYICFTLFFVVPIVRMLVHPYSWTTRASGLFGSRLLGYASQLFHWGLLVVLIGHVAGWVGGLLGLPGWVNFFYWSALTGGFAALAGSVAALLRRFAVPEVRAMSQSDDYLVHLFLIAILGIALYQVTVDGIFGLAYTAAPWFASVWTLSPQPELMASASLLTKLHVFLALTFFAYFPFTKLVHFWALPINYFVRPYQVMRTMRYTLQRKREYALRSDQSYLFYAIALSVLIAVGISLLPGKPMLAGLEASKTTPQSGIEAQTGYPLYVSQCARCHGIDGTGDGPGAGSPRFASPPRNLVAGQYRFVSTDNGVASDADIYRTILKGLPSAGMPGFAALSPQQLGSLVSVLDHFWSDRSQPGQAIAVAARPPPSDETQSTGRQLFADACAMCHGETGHGDGDLAAGILDSAGNMVPPANLAEGRLKTGRDPEQIYLRIAAGIPDGQSGSLMPAFSYFSGDEIWAVVDFLESEMLPPGGSVASTQTAR